MIRALSIEHVNLFISPNGSKAHQGWMMIAVGHKERVLLAMLYVAD